MMKRAARLANRVLVSCIVMALVTLGLPQLASPVWAAEAEGPCMDSEASLFTVTVTNISDNSDTSTPFAPGVFAVHTEPNLLFVSGQPNLGNGLEALAEDGNPAEIHTAISSMMMMDTDAMEAPGHDDDSTMMMGMSMEDMAAMAMMSMDMAMTMSADELSAMMMMGMDMMMGMSEADLAAGATLIQEVVADLTQGMSNDEITAMVTGGLTMADADAMMGMSTSDMAGMAMMGVDMVRSMSADELVGMMMLGVDMLNMDMVPMEAVVTPMMLGIEAMSDMLMGMSADDKMAMLMMGLGMVMMDEPDSKDDMMHMGKVQAGVFNTPVGMEAPGPLLPGASYAFPVVACPGTKLSLALMFVQSNDWFVSTPAEGVDLFMEDGTPMEGAIAVGLYDAGTEEDEPVGEGAHQAPRQSGPNTGPADDDNTVRGVAMIDAADLVEVTVAMAASE